MKIVIDIPEEVKQTFDNATNEDLYGNYYDYNSLIGKAIRSGKSLPKGHGRLGDLDELEKRISNYVEHDAKITDAYAVARQRFIVDGIRDTPTIIEADAAESEEVNYVL